jgi:TonB family protein
MSYDIDRQLRNIKQTRERLLGLHEFLQDRLYRCLKDYDLIDHREELNSIKPLESILQHPFPLAVKTDLSVVLNQMKHLHQDLSRLDSEISRLQTEQKQFKEAPPEPVRVMPALVKKTYGAVELKKGAHRFMGWGLGIAAAVHMILLGVYWTYNAMTPEPVATKTVRMKYIELGPPPSTMEEPPKQQPGGGRNLLGGSTANYLGVLGMIVPVNDAKAKRNTSLLLDDRSLKDLDRLMSQSQQNRGPGGGDGGYGNGTGQGYGTGNGSGVGDMDLAQVEVSGGVDDLISDVKGVQKVSLQKQGQVNIQAPGPIRGSQAAVVRRTAATVMGVINSQQGRIMYIYTKYMRADANLRGKVSIDLTIEADGSVSNAGLVESTMGNDDFVREVIAILRRLRFEPIPEGSITVNVPLVFSRVD